MSFHVPERFRILDGEMGSSMLDGNNGAFSFPPDVVRKLPGMFAIASDGREWEELGFPPPAWEHVSVSIKGQGRCPTWDELCRIKALFWDAEDCVIQFHPPRSEYENCHPYTLHLWRPIGVTIPRPPSITVGPRATI